MLLREKEMPVWLVDRIAERRDSHIKGDSLAVAFIWEKTPEKGKFWKHVYDWQIGKTHELSVCEKNGLLIPPEEVGYTPASVAESSTDE